MTVTRLPGLVDVHVHMRVPGGEHKEDFASGTAAALAGGVTQVLAMPNTSPPIVSEEVFELAEARARETARCDYALYLGATDHNAPLDPWLQDRAAGLKIYVNDTFGPLQVDSLLTMQDHFRSWRGPGPIVVHAEELFVPACIALAAQYDKHVHFAHVSRGAEIVAIRAAKERGLKVSCEVTPHHLWLDEKDLPRLGPYGDMRPRLATEGDRKALWDALRAGVVDCIATDHAPHLREEKESEQPPPGVPGLETTLPLLMNAVQATRLTLEQVVALTSTNPRRLFHLPEQPQTYVEVETGGLWTLPECGWHTRPDWSPFAGEVVGARILRTVVRDTTAYEDGVVLAEPGSGRNIRIPRLGSRNNEG
ncbi:MAG: amidohydrolase family protein [Chloroflexota bacterium]|nr:amidohydrolase family protein [Chloroflexota bacterium]